MKIRAGRCMTMSFDSKAYMTVGFQAEIPDEVKIILSQLIRKVASKDNKDIDYLQVFTLKKTYLGKTSFQKIIHTQEVPPLSESICFPFEKAIDQKVFCIDSEDYYTFLLADEY